MGVEGGGPISVEGAVTKIGLKFQEIATAVRTSFNKHTRVQHHFSRFEQS